MQTYHFRWGQSLNFHPASCSSSSVCSDSRYGGLSFRLKYDSNIHRHLPFLKIKYTIFGAVRVVHNLTEDTLAILSRLIVSITEFCYCSSFHSRSLQTRTHQTAISQFILSLQQKSKFNTVIFVDLDYAYLTGVCTCCNSYAKLFVPLLSLISTHALTSLIQT